MPTTQEQQPETQERPIWERFGHYHPYIKDSTASAPDKALTDFFFAVSEIDKYLGGDTAELVTREHTWNGIKPSPDGEIPVFVYYNIDRRRLLQTLKQYFEVKLRLPLSRMASSVSNRIRYAREIANLKARSLELNKVLTLLSDRYVFAALGQHILTVPDHADNRLIHVWEFTELGYVRAAVYALATAGLPFNGPLNAQPAQESTTNTNTTSPVESQEISQALRVFFLEATRQRITLPALPEAEGFNRANDIFAYELSNTTAPTASEYFNKVATMSGVPSKFLEAAQYLGEHLATAYNLKLYLIAVVHEQGSADWSYFTDKQAAQTYLAYRAVISNPIVRSRIATVFGESESFKSYSQSDDVADFVFNFLLHPEQAHVNILTAFSFDHKKQYKSTADIKSLVGLYLARDQNTVVFSEFDAKAVLEELLSTRDHMDEHGDELLEALTINGKWANVIDLAYSIFGEQKMLQIGKARTLELDEDPEKRILKFTTLLNMLFT